VFLMELYFGHQIWEKKEDYSSEFNVRFNFLSLQQFKRDTCFFLVINFQQNAIAQTQWIHYVHFICLYLDHKIRFCDLHIVHIGFNLLVGMLAGTVRMTKLMTIITAMSIFLGMRKYQVLHGIWNIDCTNDQTTSIFKWSK